METTNYLTSACRYCRHYKPEGRRGGNCKILGVPVESNWKACALAASPFNNRAIDLEDIFQLESSFLQSPLPAKISKISANLAKKSQSKAS